MLNKLPIREKVIVLVAFPRLEKIPHVQIALKKNNPDNAKH